MKCLVSIQSRLSAAVSGKGKGSGTVVHTMCDEAAEVATHDAVPCRALSLVELVVGHSVLAFLAVRVSTIRRLSKSVKECIMVSYCFLDQLGNILSRVTR